MWHRHVGWEWVVSFIAAFGSTLAPQPLRALCLIGATGFAIHATYCTFAGRKLGKTIWLGATYAAVAVALFVGAARIDKWRDSDSAVAAPSPPPTYLALRLRCDVALLSDDLSQAEGVLLAHTRYKYQWSRPVRHEDIRSRDGYPVRCEIFNLSDTVLRSVVLRAKATFFAKAVTAMETAGEDVTVNDTSNPAVTSEDWEIDAGTLGKSEGFRFVIASGCPDLHMVATIPNSVILENGSVPLLKEGEAQTGWVAGIHIGRAASCKPI